MSFACAIQSRASASPLFPAGSPTGRSPHGWCHSGHCFTSHSGCFPTTNILKRRHLRNLRISIGPEGSASHKLALEFLARVGVIEQKSATLLSLTPKESSAKLMNGDIDAVVLMGAWETPAVGQLLVAKDIDLVPIHRADAFVDLYPFLNKLVLPAGVADLAQNRPPTDVLLIAPKASLVVRDDLHPAIQYLLLEAATQAHSGPGVFHKEGQFPAPESIDLPLSTHARQFYKLDRRSSSEICRSGWQCWSINFWCFFFLWWGCSTRCCDSHHKYLCPFKADECTSCILN